jgi:peptidyl-prolyl cis-trans isomerase D
MQYYHNNIGLYSSEAQVKLSHILIAVAKDAKADDVAKAEAQVDAVLQKIKTSPDDFAKIARENSSDEISKAQGGDLGWLGRNELTPDLAQAAFALEVNEISKVVRSDFGFHIFKVTNKKDQHVRDFQEVKADVKAQYLKEQAETLLSNKAEELSNLAFEYPDSLKEVAAAVGLPIKESEFFSQTGSKTGIGSIKTVVEAAFKDVVLVDGKNSDLINVGDNHYVVLRKAEVQPSAQLELAAVQDKIKAALSKDKAGSAGADLGAQIVAKVQTGATLDALSKEYGQYKFAWIKKPNADRGTADVDAKIMQQVFKMAAPKANATVEAFKLANGNNVVVALSAVYPGKIIPKANENVAEIETAYKNHIAVTMGRYEYNLYEASVFDSTKIKINKLPE